MADRRDPDAAAPKLAAHHRKRRKIQTNQRLVTPMTTINDINDLVRILRENPDWADAVRGVLLSKDLLDLPETAARMARLTAETAEGTQRALQMLEELTRHSASQGGTLARLDGAHYQNHVALHGFGPLATRLDLSRIRLIHNSQADQGASLRAHLQELGIDPDQPDAHSLAPADLVYTATCSEPGGLYPVRGLAHRRRRRLHQGPQPVQDSHQAHRKAHPGHRHRNRPGRERHNPGPGQRPDRGKRGGLRPGVPGLNHDQSVKHSKAPGKRPLASTTQNRPGVQRSQRLRLTTSKNDTHLAPYLAGFHRIPSPVAAVKDRLDLPLPDSLIEDRRLGLADGIKTGLTP